MILRPARRSVRDGQGALNDLRGPPSPSHPRGGSRPKRAALQEGLSHLVPQKPYRLRVTGRECARQGFAELVQNGIGQVLLILLTHREHLLDRVRARRTEHTDLPVVGRDVQP